MSDDISLVELTADLTTAYVAGNKLEISQLPELMAAIHSSLASVGKSPPSPATESGKPTTAQIRKSIRPDALISFEDGKSYKVLKRHLTTLGMTPDEYRTKWGLPDSYPMTTASYSAYRANAAKSINFGRWPKAIPLTDSAEGGTGDEPVRVSEPKRPRGRPREIVEERSVAIAAMEVEAVAPQSEPAIETPEPHVEAEPVAAIAMDPNPLPTDEAKTRRTLTRGRANPKVKQKAS